MQKHYFTVPHIHRQQAHTNKIESCHLTARSFFSVRLGLLVMDVRGYKVVVLYPICIFFSQNDVDNAINGEAPSVLAVADNALLAAVPFLSNPSLGLLRTMAVRAWAIRARCLELAQ